MKPKKHNFIVPALVAVLFGGLCPYITAKGPDKVHPNYTITNLRSLDWEPFGITGLGWMGDDVLVAAEWGGSARKEPPPPTSKGKLHLLHGVSAATGPGDVTRETVLEGLAQPMGVLVMDDVIYLHEKGYEGTEIFKVWKEGETWKHELFASGWGEGDGHSWHSWPGGLVHKDGYFHFNVSKNMGNNDNAVNIPPLERGVWIRMNFATKEYQVMARGMRTNESTWLGPWDEIFTSDNQGDWMPDNKVYYLREGRFYGNYGSCPCEGEKESPPMVYCPHDLACESPGSGVYLKKGLFKGQMLVAEHDYRGINRYFIERINGELQGCVFDFGSTPQEAPYNGAHSQKVITGPDHETIYYGCAGDGAINWVAGPWLGSIAKLTPNGSIGFEMLAIRSLSSTEFEIEFTLPVDASLAADPGNYVIETFTREPSGGYGAGARVDYHGISVTAASIVPGSDNKKVKLDFTPGDLMTGTVEFEGDVLVGFGYTVAFDLSAVKSAQGEELFDNIAYYTLNQFGPGETPIPGCKTPTDIAFDPLANDHWDELCEGTSVLPGENNNNFPHQVDVNGPVLKITVPASQQFSVDIYDVSGKKVFTRHHLNRIFKYSGFKTTGIYFVKLMSGSRSVSKRVMIITL